jgi:hypothetical protein
VQREKRTFSGPLLEADFYPVFADGCKMPTRAQKSKPSTAEQQKYNDTMAVKKFIRLANANFDTTDYIMHPTYAPALAPQDEKQARRDIVNYLRRVKTRRASEAKKLKKDLTEANAAAKQMPGNKFLADSVKELKAKIEKLEAPFRYIYAIEKQTYKTGRYAGRANWHFHLFLTGGLDAKLLESMWTNGVRTNCNNFQPDKFGPEAAAIYMSKDPQGTKRFSYSRNLEQPAVPPPKDGKISAYTVERMAKDRVDDRAYWERRYKGYRFLRCYARYNVYNGHWYVSVVMYRMDGQAPPWKADDWLTEDYCDERRS